MSPTRIGHENQSQTGLGEPERRPEINLSRIAVGGSAGLIFVLGTMWIFLTLPEVRLFFAFSLPAGILVGIILRLAHRD